MMNAKIVFKKLILNDFMKLDSLGPVRHKHYPSRGGVAQW